jgi:tetratricopeptide (TPR) repeat protein
VAKSEPSKNEAKNLPDAVGIFPPIQLAVAGIVIGFLVVFFLSGFIEKNRPPLPASYEDEDLALQGSKLKGYTLGFDGLVADWYWMRSLQYLGDKLLKDPNQDINVDDLRSLEPRLLYPYLDSATDLDPKFIAAYQYGAVVLPAIDQEQAIKLAEKGIKNNPSEWRLYQHLGYIYWRLKQYDKAADVYATGAKIEGAPSFMPMMAASMKTQGGSRDTARDIYRQMVENPTDSVTKENAERRLMQLDALDELDAMRVAIAKFKASNPRCPNGWNEILPVLVREKLPNERSFHINERNVPVDPTGFPYLFNEAACDVSLDESRTKIPLR